ncbi:MAG: hypothetical protein JO128_10045 [Alphaproteobacteria bacterium]|nr:hypothetical protein [Alphaproteobacteria bacterium]
MSYRPIALGLALFVVAAAASGQTPPPPKSSQAEIQRLAEYIKSPAHLEAVAAAISAFEPDALAATCKTVKPVKGRSWKPVEDPVWEMYAVAPKTAAWQESWEVSACGKPGVRNIGFVARPGQGVTPLPMFPGESLADLKLQEEAGQIALDTVAPGALKCQEGHIQVIDSMVTDGTQAAQNRWTEQWIAAGCGHIVPIFVRFSPGQNGKPAFDFQAGQAH